MDVLARLDAARAATNVLEHPFYQRWSAGALSPAELSLYAGEYRHAVVALAQASALAAAVAESEHRQTLQRHATEEAEHVALWDRFAAAARARLSPAAARARLSPADARARVSPAAARPRLSPAAARARLSPAEGRVHGGKQPGESLAQATRGRALEPTKRCAEAWTAGEDLLEHLAVLYAIEASQPEIAATKLEGLVEHYGYQPEGPAVEYFRLHERLDVEHARQARELIRALLACCADTGATEARMLPRAERALRGNWELLGGVEAAQR